MSKAVYIATMEKGSGKSIVTLGLMRMLRGKVAKVGYFKPIISDLEEGELDNHISTTLSHFKLDIEYEKAYAFTKSEVLAKMHQGKTDAVFDRIIERFKAIEEKHDYVLVEGTDFSGEGTAVELEINTDIAKNLGIPAMIVESGESKSMNDFKDNLLSTYDLFEENDVKVLAVIANKVRPENMEWVQDELYHQLPKKVVVGHTKD